MTSLQKCYFRGRFIGLFFLVIVANTQIKITAIFILIIKPYTDII